MRGYHPLGGREPVPMAQVYPPARSYSLAKLNQYPRDSGIYEKVKGGMPPKSDRRPNKMFEQLRRQQSCDGDLLYPRMQYYSQPRRQEGFDSLQLLGTRNDDRYLDRFMDNSRGKPNSREMELNKGKNTLPSTKSGNSKSSLTRTKNNNKENKKNTSATQEILALLGSLTSSTSVDNIYESVEQIHYRKSMEMANRREKVRSVHRTGHPLFDHLREERALASAQGNENTIKRMSKSAGPSRKTSTVSSPIQSNSPSSSGDEREFSSRANFYQNKHVLSRHQRPMATSWHKGGSAGSESDDEWVIPRPKIGGRKRESRTLSTDESDSSSKSGPMR